jgi:hypothetical protein
MAATTTHPAAQAIQTRTTAIKKAYCGRDNGTPSAGVRTPPNWRHHVRYPEGAKVPKNFQVIRELFTDRETDLADLTAALRPS